jgi:hypothetical protein
LDYSPNFTEVGNSETIHETTENEEPTFNESGEAKEANEVEEANEIELTEEVVPLPDLPPLSSQLNMHNLLMYCLLRQSQR